MVEASRLHHLTDAINLKPIWITIGIDVPCLYNGRMPSAVPTVTPVKPLKGGFMSHPSPDDYAALDRPEVLQNLFHPRKTAGPRKNRGPLQEILIPVDDNVRVGACVHAMHPTGPVILFFHGNGEVAPDYDDIGPLFNRLGINLIVADYRGYGCSEGNPTVSAMMADCHAIFDFVLDWQAANGFSGPRIVMGRSLGSASALELAAAHADRIHGLAGLKADLPLQGPCCGCWVWIRIVSDSVSPPDLPMWIKSAA